MTVKSSKFWSLVVGLLINKISGYEILVVFPEPTRSHGILGDGYVRLLLEAHHKVTYVTPFPWKHPPENLTQVDISSNLKISSDVMDKLKEDHTEQSKFLLMLSYSFGEMAVKHSSVRELLRTSGQRFDIVIAEWIDSELYSSFAAYFNCSLIWSVSTHLHWQPLRLMDEVANPSYSADVNSGYTPPLSLMQRLHELWIQIRKCWIMHFTIYPLEKELYSTVFGEAAREKNISLPPYEEVPDTYSMMLVNTHPSVATPWRVPPSVKEIAGYHIKLPPDNLDLLLISSDEALHIIRIELHLQALESIMNASSQGVIYFSLGSTPASLTKNIVEDLLSVFADFKQTILWKMEEPIENVPHNVYLMEWAPQTSILSHPNTKLFISHGGLLSVIEAIHFGVPVIAVPRAADQFTNVEAIVGKGVGIKLENDEEFPKNLRKALAMMLNDQSYKQNMMKLSWIYHDRPTAPGAELVHWVQHAVRTRGAAHLRSPALATPLHQKMYLDLAGIILAILTALTIILILICWRIRKLCR